MKRFTSLFGIAIAVLSLGGCVVNDGNYYDRPSRHRGYGPSSFYDPYPYGPYDDYSRFDGVRSSRGYRECMSTRGRRDDYCYDQARTGNYGWRAPSPPDGIRSNNAYRECMSTPGRRDDYCYDQVRTKNYGWRR